MIRTLLTTSALAALLGTAVIAQDVQPPADPAPPSVEAPVDPVPAPAPADPAAPAPAEPAPAPVDPVPAAPPAVDPVESGALEQTEIREPWDISQGYIAVDTDNLGSNLMGSPVYSSASDDAENIGTINDIVFSADGTIQAVVIGVGGFLGIGEKQVAADFRALEVVVAADNTERWVLPTTSEALEAAPEFVWQEDEPLDFNDPAMAPEPMLPQ